MNEMPRQALKELIQNKVILFKSREKFVSSYSQDEKWIFDFRRVFLDSKNLPLIADIFLETFADQYPFQVAGLESAAIPLITAIVMRSHEKGRPLNGFFIRKSRNKRGLLKMIEGEPNSHKVILVDDLINSGSTFLRQIEVLRENELDLHSIFTLVRFRDLSYYTFAHDMGIPIHSVFTLEDFGRSIRHKVQIEPLPYKAFEKKWSVGAEHPNLHYVVPKSAPIVDDDKVYFGCDAGYMLALYQKDGSVAWKFRIHGPGSQGKKIFSSPAICKNQLFFGDYNGNLYALNKNSGSLNWVKSVADWVGSSPAIAEDLNLVFIGLEFGLEGRRGGIAALDLDSGEPCWSYSLPGLTHGSPAYSAKLGVVAIGSNDGSFSLFRAKTGELLWQVQIGFEIKASAVFDEQRGYVIFGAFDGKVYILDVQTGKEAFHFSTAVAIYSTPAIDDERLYVASLGKKIYCLNLDSFDVEWSFNARTRIFSSPLIVGDRVYLGTNGARFVELDCKTGELKGLLQLTERITNKAAYNPTTKDFFVPTFANEIHCVKRVSDEELCKDQVH